MSDNREQSMNRADCERVSELLEEYLFGELDENERTFVESHIEICESCRASLEDERELLSAFSEGEQEVPSELYEQVMASVKADLANGGEACAENAEKASEKEKEPEKRAKLLYPFLRRFATVAAAVVVAFGIFFAVMNSSENKKSDSIPNNSGPNSETAGDGWSDQVGEDTGTNGGNNSGNSGNIGGNDDPNNGEDNEDKHYPPPSSPQPIDPEKLLSGASGYNYAPTVYLEATGNNLPMPFGVIDLFETGVRYDAPDGTLSLRLASSGENFNLELESKNGKYSGKASLASKDDYFLFYSDDGKLKLLFRVESYSSEQIEVSFAKYGSLA